MADSWVHLTGHRQTAAMCHQAMAQIAEVDPYAVGPAEQSARAVAAGAVSLVEQQQTTEIPLGALLSLGRSKANAVAATGCWWVGVGPVDPAQ